MCKTVSPCDFHDNDNINYYYFGRSPIETKKNNKDLTIK